MRGGFMFVMLSVITAAGADSLTFAPGNGVATNVTERLYGSYDSVEINSGTNGGGMVNFANSWNLHSGGATVNCGTLSLSGMLRPIGQPSALGRGTTSEKITIKDGTFHYAGDDAETDRGLTLAPTGADKAAVVSVADGTSLKFTGPVTSKNGVLVKRGGGTLVLKPTTSVSSNCFCHASLTGTDALTFPANGDAPTAGYGELTVQEGRLVIDFPEGVTNVFYGGQVASGKDAVVIGRTPVNESVAGEAHLEIRGGMNYASRFVYVGYQAGNATNTTTTLHHSLDVLGGLFDNNHGEGCSIYVGVSSGVDNRSVGEVNVLGGKLRTFYYRPACSPGSVSKTFIANGTLECYGVYAGQYTASGFYVSNWDDPQAALIPEMEITVSTNGLLYLNGGPYYLNRDSLVRHTLKVTDGGRVQFQGFRAAVVASYNAAIRDNERMTVILDGGTLDISGQASTDMVSLKGVTTKLGAGGGRLTSTKASAVYTFLGPIVSDDGVAEDGGLELDGPATCRLFCENSFSGDVRLTGAGTLVLSNGLTAAGVNIGDAGVLAAVSPVVTIPSLVCRDSTVTLKAVYAGSAATRYDLGAFTPPSEVLYFKLEGSYPAGEYELVTYPASVVFDATRAMVEGGNISSGKEYSFRTVTAGEITKLVMTVKAVSTPSATAVSWSNVNGGAWSAAGNWSGTAPAADTPAAVTFAATPAADPVTVTLDATQQVTSLSFPAMPGYRVAGKGAFELVNGSSAATVTAAGGATNLIEVPVTAKGNVVFNIPKRGHVEFASLSGTANLSTTVDNNGYGGVVKIADASGLRGSISFQRGLLELGTMPALLTALDIGFGEFRYTGAEAKRISCPMSLIATQYSNTKLCVADANGELYIDGALTMSVGSLTKTGKGLVVFDGVRDYDFAVNAAGYSYFTHPVQMTDMICPNKVWGFMWESSGRDHSLVTTFAGGTVRWGADGQRVTFGKVGFDGLAVGSISTGEPGKELDAYAEIVGGETEAKGRIIVGFYHGYPGTAEHTALTSRVTMTAGELRGTDLYVLYDDKYTCSSRPEWLHRGGNARFSGTINVGHVGSADSSALLEVSGGTIGCDGSLCMGKANETKASSATGRVRLTGGILDAVGAIYMGYGTNRVEVLEGGTLRTCGIDILAAGDNRVLFDGGTLKPFSITAAGGRISGNLGEVALGAKGMVVNLVDLPTNTFSIARKLVRASGVAEDGGVTVRGEGGYHPGSLVFEDQQQTGFSGRLTVEDGGNVRIRSNPSVTSNFIVTVRNGGAFGAQWTSAANKYGCVKSLALGEAATDSVVIQVQIAYPSYTGKYAGTVWATDILSVPGKVEVAFVDNLHTEFINPDYPVTVLIAPKGSINAEKFKLSSHCPPATASFTVESFDDDYDMLTVSLVAATSSTHTWASSAGGDWSVAENWDSAPIDSIYDCILFPATFSGGTIDLGGDRQARSVASASEGEVTLSGGTLTLAGSAAMNTVSNGVLRLPALQADCEVSVNATAPAGKVVFGGSKGDTVISSAGGTVEGSAENFGTGEVKISDSTVSVTGNGMVNAKITGSNGMNLRTDGEAYFLKDVSVSGPFVKSGPGTAYLCGSGSVTIGNDARKDNSDDATLAATHLPANGDMPKDSLGGAFTVVAGKLVLGVDGEQRIAIKSYRLDIGSSFYELDGDGNVLGAEVELLDGTLASTSDLNIGRNPGRYAKETEELAGKRRDLAFTIRGGEASFTSFYMLHDKSGKFSGNTRLNVCGGHLKFSGNYVRVGYDYRSGCTNFVNVSGGLLEFANAKPYWEDGIFNSMAVLNLTGGELKTAYPLSSAFNDNNQYLVYNLAGGRLNVPFLRRVSTKGVENLVWDGGVYAPTSNNCSIACQQLWTKHECRAGGAKIDLSGVVPVASGDPISFSMNQTLAHAEELGAAEDGGIELLGGGTLTLDAANTMNGPVVVSGGTVKPTVAAAVSGGVVVNGTGVFDVNGQAVTAAYLKGAGGTVAGGTLGVAGEIAPSTFVTVSSVACGSGAVLKCPLEETEDGYVTTLVKVAPNGAVTKEGKLPVDFCLDEDDILPKTFAVKIAELGAGATFPGALGVLKTGHEPKHYRLEASYRTGDGCTEVWAELRGPGIVVNFR